MEKKVSRQGNVLLLYRMDHPVCATHFLRHLQEGIKKGFRSFVIKWCGELVYPDACVPIAGIISYYREKEGIEFSYDVRTDSYLQRCGFLAPFEEDVSRIKQELAPFDKLYRYCNSGQVAALTQAYIDHLSRLTECSEGVLTGLTWCLNEVMDNVLLHSEATYGLVMMQYHPAKRTVAICVYDSGIGIYHSLSRSKHKPKTASDAISLAIQEGVGDGKGQGNGLFGLYQVVFENKGSFTITSGSSSIMWASDREMKKFEHLPFLSKEFNATSIDFQLKLDHAINIQTAFGSIGGFDGFDIRLDDMLQEDDSYVYDVYENSRGTATREAGALLRNDVLNTLRRIEAGLTLNFQGVKTVSSSFADEFLAKLVLHMGFLQFNRLIRLANVNDNVRFLVERSLYMRIHDEWAERDKKAPPHEGEAKVGGGEIED